jgi:hypothetical protein
MAKRAPDLVQIKIRMPRVLHQKLARDAARTTAHTINAEIVKRLEASYQPDTLRKDIAEIKQAQAKLSGRFFQYWGASPAFSTAEGKPSRAEMEKAKRDKTDH